MYNNFAQSWINVYTVYSTVCVCHYFCCTKCKSWNKTKTMLYNSSVADRLRMEDTCLETAWLWSWGHEGEAQSAQDNKGTASFSSLKFILSLIINDVSELCQTSMI